MEFKTTDKISEEDRNEIFEGLLEYNLARIEDKNPKDLGIYVEDANGRKLAGLIGETHGNWMIIKYLWVSEMLRGQHLGSSILKQAEKAAIERGCKYAFWIPSIFKRLNFIKNMAIKKYLH